MTKGKEGILPIEWEEYNIEYTSYIFYNATFTEDFGNIKAGETFKSIAVDYSKGIIDIYDEKGIDVLNTIHFKCVSIEDDMQIRNQTVEQCIDIVKSHINLNCDNHYSYGECSNCGRSDNPDLIKTPDELLEELENKYKTKI